ncbi:hypothetical protein [Comamonas thiooxydans]|uniref:hypothetical protein n=1 Tax=Comamonas thiooxydans TaxID=363952 RepID=UPI000B40E435|nr:hypothetical protein [Comamonas thiooxydans]
MDRIFHSTDDDLVQTMAVIKSLTAAQRRILDECIEHSGVTRKCASAAAIALSDLGLAFIREEGSIAVGTRCVHIKSSVFAEEAIEALDVGWSAASAAVTS